MRWNVDGVESKTGEEIRVTVDAKNEKEAIEIAACQGVLTEKVSPEIPYASPSTPPRSQTASAVRFQPFRYRQLLRTAEGLATFAKAFIVLGCIGVAVGVFIVGVAANAQRPTEGGAQLVASSLFVIFASAIIRLLCLMGLALRQVAINLDDMADRDHRKG